MKRLISLIRFYSGITLSMLSIVLIVIGSFEARIVTKISQSVVGNSSEPMAKIDKLLAFTSHQYKQRSFLINSFQDIAMPGVLGQLIVPNKDCGGVAEIFRSLAHAEGFQTRFIQMLCSNFKHNACHIIVDVRIDNIWYPVDPLYGFRFVDDNQEAVTSFEEIHSNWQKYQKQTPEGYDLTYDYYGKRMVNWNKNALTRLLQQTLLLIYSNDEVQEMNPRTFITNYWYFWALITGVLYAGIIFVSSMILHCLKKVT